MGKHPYIPFYVGDYLKDTRVLPLAVRGAWVDLILFMWDAPVRGEIIGTIQDFARLMSCERSEAEFALDLLKQKCTADFVLLPDGQIKIVSRKMKRESEISSMRSETGKKGVNAKREKKFASAKVEAKHKQNTEYDIENENKVLNKKESSEKTKLDWFEELFLDARWIEEMTITHKGKDIKQAFEECYQHHSLSRSPPQELWEWKQKLNTWLTIKSPEKTKKNGKSGITAQGTIDRLNSYS